MCSVLGILKLRGSAERLREEALARSRRQRHRGPDWSGIFVGRSALLAHERLGIVDVEHGAQPLRSADGKQVLAVNGEVYNHRELRTELKDFAFSTGSDCEVILPLASRGDFGFLNRLNGIFAFVWVDDESGRFLIARDPIGVMPLYYGHDAEDQLWVASELKALVGKVPKIHEFPPGHYWTESDPAPVPYYQPSWRDFDAVNGNEVPLSELHRALDAAVRRQLMSDVPYGTLLSGGLDSSLIAALAKRYTRDRVEDDLKSPAWWPQLHSFAIGLPDSPDLEKAAIAAERIGTIHHAFRYTVQEGIDALADVIYHIESFDVTTVRASTPMFLLARRIRSMGIKMVLTGEGSDEIFGGYLYFHKAPTPRALHEETVRKLDLLHKYDCLRANKSLAAWGVEGRVPFLDREFLDVAMSIDPAQKMCGPQRSEKHVLRKAFRGLLPDEILWRQKEQFSDGVGYGWIDGLKAHAEQKISNADLADAARRFSLNPPATKEAYLYRHMFEEHFGPDAAATVPGGKSIACSTEAALQWEASFADRADPSGRAVLGVHEHATD